MGVNGTDEPKGNYAVYELGCDYAVYDISGEFFLPNGGQGASKVIMACHCKAIEWINIQMFTAEGGYP